ncbi:MAG: lysylphosphatidylglycerol synthase transmembrane domain-containing protein [Coprothermobacterota bacterium]|nr:lysylphosphatidylglycerol synthase transmembrane domain-containing protein [Coprothermobacterota bacterium]
MEESHRKAEAWKRGLLLAGILGLLVFVALLFWGDARAVGAKILTLSASLAFFLVVLSAFDYYFRFLRWQFLLKPFHFSLRHQESLIVFLAGLSLSATPGNLGEAVKSFLLEKRDIPVSKTLPVVFAERLSDGSGIALLATVGAVQFHYGWTILVAFMCFFLLAMLLISREKWFLSLIKFLRSRGKLSHVADSLDSFYASVRLVFTWKRLAFAIFLSACSAFFQTVAFFYLLKGIYAQITFMEALFFLNLSSIAGGVSLSPGGLVVVEGSLMALLLSRQVPVEAAATSVMIVRFFNLWLGFIVGIFALRWTIAHWVLDERY